MKMIDDFFDSIYPRGNTHELTLDWILQEVKKCVAGWETTNTRFKNIEDAIEELVRWFTSFNNSPVFVAKIREALQAMYDNGQLEELLRNIVDVNVWNNEYVLFGRVPSPNGFFSGRLYSWIDSAIQAPNFKDVIKIGANTFKRCTQGLSDCIGIGTGVMSENQVGTHNIGIGMFALSNLEGSGNSSGTRNIAIGSYAYLFAKNLIKSIGIGRDVCQNVVTGENNTVVGYCAMGGYAHIGLDGSIVNGAEIEARKATILGAYNMINTNDINNTVSIGAFCGVSAKNSSANVLIGSSCLLHNGEDISVHGKTMDFTEQTGTYIARGSNITMSILNNHAVAGNYVRVLFTSGGLSEITNEEQLLYVSQNGDPEFILITDYDNLDASGECTVIGYETNTPNDYVFEQNTIIGNSALEFNSRLRSSTVVGSSALMHTPLVEYCSVLGRNVGYERMTSAKQLCAMGNGAINQAETSQNDTMIGSNAGNCLLHSTGNTFVGYGAGSRMIDDSTGATVQNTTIIGYGARCSGSNEVCLGSYGTTPYAYAQLQVRSDERDKTDIRETILGLDFINKLTPVDFKWNVRESYENFDNSSMTNKGHRYHHGFIAQDIEKIINETGIDFGGYQDHAINGGCDVKSIGYDELIAPMVKAIQELTARVHQLEDELNKIK